MSFSKVKLPYRLNPPDVNDFIDGFIRQGHAFVVALDQKGKIVCVKKWSRRSLADSDKLEFNLSTYYATPQAWNRDLNVARVEVTLDKHQVS